MRNYLRYFGLFTLIKLMLNAIIGTMFNALLNKFKKVPQAGEDNTSNSLSEEHKAFGNPG